MGKISKWFKALLLGFKKNDSFSSSSSTKKKKKWIDVKSYEDEDFQHYDDDDKAHYYYGVSVSVSSVHGQNEAGVDLANDGEVHSNVMMWNGEEWAAAVVIQSYFRAYLSRRALRALKGLVKLQALVRGHIVRKQTADMLRRMQALIRAQSRARAGRSQVFESPRLFSSTKSTQFLHHGLATPDKFEQIIRARSMKNDQMFMFKRNSSNHMGNRMDKTQGSFARNGSIDDENIVKILEIDIAKQRNLFHSSELSYNSDQFCFNNDETCYTSVDNSPQSRCSRSKTGPLFTQTKSGCSDDNHPNYMSYTEAAKAKTRSMSAPKLRPQYDHKRYSRSNMQNGTNFYANFTSKGNYQGSGRLDKIGMPA